MSRLLKRVSLALVILLLPLLALLYYLTLTQHGLQFAGRVLTSRYADTIQLGELQGALLKTISVSNLQLQLDGDSYRLGQVQLDWSPWALLAGELKIDRLVANQVEVNLAARASDADSELVIDIALPLAITLADATITSLTINGAGDNPLTFGRIGLSAQATGGLLHIAAFTLATDSYSATLDGVLGLVPGNGSDLNLGWSVTTAALTTAGQARVSGLPDAYTLQGDASLAGKQLPSGQWQFTATGGLDALDVAQLDGSTLEGTVTGQGRLDWAQGLGWQASLSLQQLNPAGHWPEWPGALTAGLTTTGGLQDGRWHGRVQLQQLQGQLRNHPVTGQIDVEFDDTLLMLRELQLTSADNSLSASGTLDSRWSMAVQATVNEMAAVLPGWQGQLALEGSLAGARDAPALELAVTAAGLAGTALAVDALSLQAQLSLSAAGEQAVTATAETLTVAGQSYDEARLALDGTLHNHRLSLTATGHESAVDVQLSGDWVDPLWRGELRQADWSYPGAGTWTLQRSVALELGQSRVHIPELCWEQQPAWLCVQATGEPAAELTARARLQDFPLAALGMIKQLPVRLASRIDADLQTSLSVGQVQEATLRVDLGEGRIDYRDDSLPADTQIRRGLLSAKLGSAGLSAMAELDLSGDDQLRADLELPGYQAGITPWAEQSLALNVRGELHDMLFIKYLLDEVGQYKGSLLVDLQGAGTLARPRLSGGASIQDASLEIDRLGINLNNLDIQLRSKDDGLSLTGRCDSGEGSVELNGDITIMDVANWQADVRLQGSDFEVMHLPEGVIVVSPDLRARLTPPDLLLTGELHVPYARLRPRDLKKRTGISSDVVIVLEEQPLLEQPSERWQVSSDIRLSLGDDVTIDGMGLKGDILGNLNLLDTPGQATTARGRLSIERGSYEAYGRLLDIHRGQLLFSGGPVDNPGLDFEASRKIEDVTAGIRARGTLREPELSLYSDPAMADSDIISYIAFGTPQSQVGQGGGSVTDAGLVAGGNMLAGVIGTRAGLEELGIESGDTLEEASMVLGTYLSPKLYVRYRTGLYDAINEFEVRYEFSRRWSVHTVTSSEASSAELQFSFER